MKICCRSRRTLFSWWHQSMASQYKACPRAHSRHRSPNFPFGSSASGCSCSQAHLPHVICPRSRAPDPVSGGYTGQPTEVSARYRPRCTLSCRLSITNSLVGQSFPAEEYDPAYDRLTGRGERRTATDGPNISKVESCEVSADRHAGDAVKAAWTWRR